MGREDCGGVSTPGRFTSIRLFTKRPDLRRDKQSSLMLGSFEGGEEGLACRLATILPAMRLAEAREPTCIHRVAGLTGGHTAFVTTRLFRRGTGHTTATATGNSAYG